MSGAFHTADVAALHVRAVLAIAELRSLRCADVAAAEALTAVKLAIYTLEQWWLPALEALTAGEASP